MKKTYQIILVVVGVAVLGVGGYFVMRYNKIYSQDSIPIVTHFDPRSGTYSIESTPITLVDGKANVNMDSTTTSIAIFGQPVFGDLNGDGTDDAAFFMTQDGGGSGMFYYVVAALDERAGTVRTNAIFLGDRIVPQNINIKNGQILVNYVDRKPNEPMITPPSLIVSLYLTVDGSILKKSVARVQTITYLTSESDPTKYCNGVDMDSVGYQKTITTEHSTSTSENDPSTLQIIKDTLNAATTGMCHTVLSRIALTENNGTVYIPPIDAWAGMSIAMCSCKPEVEVNVLRIPGITKVIWSTDDGTSEN